MNNDYDYELRTTNYELFNVQARTCKAVAERL